MQRRVTALLLALLAPACLVQAQSQCPDSTTLALSRARLKQLCDPSISPVSARSIGCTMFTFCEDPSVQPPIFPSVCDLWRITSALCSDDSDITASVPECAQLPSEFSSQQQYSNCLAPYTFRSTSAARANTIQMCADMGDISLMDGCEECTTQSCPRPFDAYTRACTNMTMNGCEDWLKFCAGEARVGNQDGWAAAVLCLLPKDRNGISAPPRPPLPPSPPGITQPPPVQSSPSPSPAGNPLPACVASPTSGCEDYVYPAASVQADINSLCTSMPYMPGCSIQNACRARQMSGLYCEPFNVLATICTDMPTMAGCRNYLSICKPTTDASVVKQCKTYPGVAGVPSTDVAKDAVKRVCNGMYMPQCADCTTLRCSDPLGTLASMCIEMPTMDGCGTYLDWCDTSLEWGRNMSAAMGSSGRSSSISYYCPSAIAAGNLASIPSMLMYFHQRVSEVLLWKAWIPRTNGQYVGAFIAILVMGIGSVGLRVGQEMLLRKWDTAAALAVARSQGLALHSGAPSYDGVAWYYRPLALNILQRCTKGVMAAIITCIDLWTMLIAMTFNIGFFVAVCIGYGLGAAFFSTTSASCCTHDPVGTPAIAPGALVAKQIELPCAPQPPVQESAVLRSCCDRSQSRSQSSDSDRPPVSPDNKV